MTNLNTIRSILAAKKGAVEEYPFGPGAMVYKAGGKIFAIVSIDSDPLSISLKCEPMEAEALRAEYPAITPGYHLNKKHWNTVVLDGSVPNDLVEDMIDGSYDLIVKSLSKVDRLHLGNDAK